MSQNTESNASGRENARKLLVPTYLQQPITLVRGERCTLWDAEGKSYLDLMGGIATAALGHCHPAISAAHCRCGDVAFSWSPFAFVGVGWFADIKPRFDLAIARWRGDDGPLSRF